MEEGEIRQLAGMYALVTKMHSINAEIEGMKALNQYRIDRNETIAYDDIAFFEMAGKLNFIASELKEKI